MRPIHHRLAERVRAHTLVCMLAYCLEWHISEAWRSILFADDDQAAKLHRDPVAAAKRSAAAERKALTHALSDGTPVHSLRTLFEALSTIVRNTCRTVHVSAHAPLPHHHATQSRPATRLGAARHGHRVASRQHPRVQSIH